LVLHKTWSVMHIINQPPGADLHQVLLKTFANQNQMPFTASTHSPLGLRRRRRRGFKFRVPSMKEIILQGATADDLAKLDRSVLIEALRYKGLVFTVKEMAKLACCDEETIRRKTKDGTLRKVPGIRHIRVHFDVFFAWLRAEKK